MADNVAITAGTGTSIAADNISSVYYQRMKLALGPDGTYTADADGTAARGIYVDARPSVVRIQVTPTVSTSPAYTAKDAIGGLLTFANAVRASGGTCRIEAVQIEDQGQQMANMDLVLFDRTFTAPTDNAIFAPSDAELLTCVGVINIGSGFYADFSTNSIAVVNNVGLQVVLNGTSLFGALVNRGTPTYTATGDIIVTITISQD